MTEEELEVQIERAKQEIEQRLDPIEREFKRLLQEFKSTKFELESKLAQRVEDKSDSMAEILKLKNDLYGFVDSKVTHNH